MIINKRELSENKSLFLFTKIFKLDRFSAIIILIN